ncbi:MAG TPA: M6 family metalloprotease domain-containing protein [Candidatus Krumholzibacteria bacterium]|nr:M6 family metalloprotease domain-containing protein [Candidatus Krumholzibacteria bacterium]HPD71208.1 M6 family metalloprotease domain-containing protein [Candidatus Krumholzibacteria bacterium]HRY39092.1 M6 family metalloprotease domain-containing protein [Candidatus Krumholzibacteria bacterium]
MQIQPIPPRRIAAGALLLAGVLLAAAAVRAAPYHGEAFRLGQPDGSLVDVRVWGDEFYQRVESLDGYTLVRDPATGVICYADLAGDASGFVSTGIPVSQPAPAGLRRGLQLAPAARAAAARAVRDAFLAAEAAVQAGRDRDPQPSDQGDVLGLTLIIDFSDEVGTVPPADFDAYLNLVGYTGYGNNGSIRDYFHDVSGGALTYTNWVPPAYLRAPNPKAYYEDPSIPYGQRARQLVAWSLNELDNGGHDFSQYDANDDGYIDAINVFYAGWPTGGWSVGLWPHSSVVSFSADGVSAYRYQITNIGSALRLGTFCHENGHMICFWPDLYDYGYESNGVGNFCLMCYSGSGINPVRPCAYMRATSGWVDPVELSGLQTGLVVSHETMNVFKVPYAGVPNEYYLLENRQRVGRDAGLPDSGLAIWHVDEYGSNNDEQQTPAQHYLVTLVQADGRWDLENGANYGDAGDLWKAPTYVVFDPTTAPPAVWWDGRDAPLYVDEIGYSGPEMSFDYREGPGTLAVTIEPLPTGITAPWTLVGPGDYRLEGEGFRSVLVWAEGLYTLTWGDVPGWNEPDPPASSFTLVEGGAPAHVVGTYTNPPFALVEGGAGHAGAIAALAVVDYDQDGDDDLHLIHDGEADLLLRNDGGLAFTEATPAPLADPGAGRAAAWGDYDNDGDRDVYLVRDGEPNLLLEQIDGVFTDVTAFSYGVGDAGAGADAAWCDFDADGLLDLYLVQDGPGNVVFKNFGDFGTGHPLLATVGHPALQNVGPGQTAVWCDYDSDGDRDAYLVNDGTPNVLVRSHLGTAFEDAGDSDLANDGPGQDAGWGDFDNDGDWDLYLVNFAEPDAYFNNQTTYFQRIWQPVVSDPGPGRSVAVADFDNDGALDVYVARRGAEDLLVFGDGAGGFQRAPLAVPEVSGDCVVAVASDLDRDGGVDLYVGRNGAANLILRNVIQDRGHWLELDLRADPANRDAVGARARVVADGVAQLREVQAGDGRGQAGRILHVGLGAASAADSVVVTWPGGGQTVLAGVAGDRRVTVEQNPDPTAAPDPEVRLVSGLRDIRPNPFNPAATIAYAVAEPGFVHLAIYGLDGRLVAELVREDQAAGHHQAVWRGSDAEGRPAASGTYLCRLHTSDGVSCRRLTLVK